MSDRRLSSVDEQLQSAHKSYGLLLFSNLLFVGGSLCFLIAAILDLKEFESTESTSIEVWIMLVLGGSSFALLGIVDYSNTGDSFNCFMLLAGIAGAISAGLNDRKLYTSNIFNAISVHLYLCESFAMVYGHYKWSRMNKRWIPSTFFLAEFGDFCFLAGSLIDVILSYFYLQQKDALSWNDKQSIRTDQGEVISAALWLISSLIATLVICRLGKDGFQPNHQQQQQKQHPETEMMNTESEII